MLKRMLLLFEFSLGFAVPVMFLFYGVAFGPFALFAGVVGGDYLGAVAILVATVGGFLGLSAAMQLLSLQIYPDVRVASPKRLMVRVIAGVISILVFSPMFTELPWFVAVAMVLPVPVVAHLLYLNRTYLFNFARR